MPLHLLGKKSWNVYSKENIAKVRRDEADAAATEAAEEQRMQEIDAARRTAILRGETPPPLSLTEDSSVTHSGLEHPETGGTKSWDHEQRRKRRRLHGEDDTDRDIRLAREDHQAGHEAKRRLVEHTEDKTPLTDANGHIQLFAGPDDGRGSKKAQQASKDAPPRKRGEEDAVGLRFNDAAGFKASKNGPWYAATGRREASSAEDVGRDAFGNEDSGRKQRDERRVVSNDPMAAMRAAQARLKQTGRERAEWEQKQKAKIRRLDEEEERRRRTSRGRGGDDDLNGFSLDAPQSGERDAARRKHRESGGRSQRDYDRGDEGRRHHHHRHVHRDRHRSRSPRPPTHCGRYSPK